MVNMPFNSFSTSLPPIPPVDSEVVDKIVSKLKSQGIFDQFRKDCLADVDTKPAYQNLQQRVNTSVASFLATQKWQPDLNKTQLRESLRRHVQQRFMEVGIDRIVDQVVNPKIVAVFMPNVQDVVCDFLGIEKPKQPISATFSAQFLTSFPPPLLRPSTPPKANPSDLLPKDLDPVSPESDHVCMNGDETPLKDERNNNDDDSQLSGISELSSHLGDSFQDNPADSNTVKSITSPKPESSNFKFDNFENLSEKLKQAESQFGPVSGSQTENAGDDMSVSDELTVASPKEIKEETVTDEIKFEFMSNNSVSTFEDSKIFVTNRQIKEETFSQTFSEDSMTSSILPSRVKIEPNLLKPLKDSESSSTVVEDTDVNSSGTNEISELKDIYQNLGINEPKVDAPTIEETVPNNLEEEHKKVDHQPRDKKNKESYSSKHSRNSDRPKHSDSKNHTKDDRHRDSSHHSKDDRRRDSSHSSKDDKHRDSSHSLKDDKHRGYSHYSKDDKHRDSSHYSKDDKHRDKSHDKESSLNKEEKLDRPSKDEKHRSSHKDDRNKSHEKPEKDSRYKENSDKSRKDDKEKAYCKDKDKLKKSSHDDSHKLSHKDDKNRYKDEKNTSSRDKNHERDRNNEKTVEYCPEQKEIKVEPKEISERDKKRDKSIEKDRTNKDKEHSSKSRHDSEKEKGHSSRGKHSHDRDKDKNDRANKNEKLEKENEKQNKDKNRSDKDSDKKYEKERDREGKHSKEKHSGDKTKEKHSDYKTKDKNTDDKAKDKHSDDKARDNKARESRSHEKYSNPSSLLKKTDDNKTEDKDKRAKTDLSNNSKKNAEDTKRDKKRKGERCNDEIKAKDARRSSDRDSSGSKEGRNSGHKSSENRANSSRGSKLSSSSGKKSKSSTSSGTNSSQDQHEKPTDETNVTLDQVDCGSSNQENTGPSEIELILSRLNSSIEESETAANNKEDDGIEEVPVKKPKIAKNFAEVRKIMQARKNIDRKFKAKDMSDSVLEESQGSNQTESRTQDENKENIKTVGLKNNKVGKDVKDLESFFYGFSEPEIHITVNNFLTFENASHEEYVRRISGTEDNLSCFKNNSMDNYGELLDNNLNKLKTKTISYLESNGKQIELIEDGVKGNTQSKLRSCTVVLERNSPKVVQHLKHIVQEDSPPPAKRDKKRSRGSAERGEAVRAHDEVRVEGSAVPPEDKPSEAEPVGLAITPDEIEHPRANDGPISQPYEVGDLKIDQSPLKSPVPDVASPDSPESCTGEEKLSVSLTEDMLNNLLKESIKTGGDDSEGRDESDYEELTEEIVLNPEIEKNVVGPASRHKDVGAPGSMVKQEAVNRKENFVTNHISEISRLGEGESEESKDKRQRRVTRTSQRYNSSDLYKPRPVLSHTSSRRSPKNGADDSEGLDKLHNEKLKEEVSVNHKTTIMKGNTGNKDVCIASSLKDAGESENTVQKEAVNQNKDIFTNHVSEISGLGDGEAEDSNDKRQKRVSRASQRYNSSDLYKPRPVLLQTSTRRSPRSASTEGVNLRKRKDPSEPPTKKRAR